MCMLHRSYLNAPVVATHLVHIKYADQLIKGTVQLVKECHNGGRSNLLGHAGEATMCINISVFLQ